MLVRFGKRRTAWESSTVAEVREAEFRHRSTGLVDLRISGYDIERGTLIRTYAEHTVGAAIDPVKPYADAVDLQGVAEARPSPGSPTFAHVRDAHRELVFADAEGLDMAIATVLADIARRMTNVRKCDVIEYARGRFAARDREWLAAAESPDAKSWVKDLARRSA